MISDGVDISITVRFENTYQIITQEHDIVDFETYSGETLYWNVKGSEIIQSSNRNYPEFKQPELWCPKAIAADHWNQKLYVIDKLGEKINVFDIKSKYYSILLSDLNKPSDLVLDISMAVMFFLQSSKSVSPFCSDFFPVNHIGLSPRRILYFIHATLSDFAEFFFVDSNNLEKIVSTVFGSNKNLLHPLSAYFIFSSLKSNFYLFPIQMIYF